MVFILNVEHRTQPVSNISHLEHIGNKVFGEKRIEGEGVKSMVSCFSEGQRTAFEPMKPAAPVTNIRILKTSFKPELRNRDGERDKHQTSNNQRPKRTERAKSVRLNTGMEDRSWRRSKLGKQKAEISGIKSESCPVK